MNLRKLSLTFFALIVSTSNALATDFEIGGEETVEAPFISGRFVNRFDSTDPADEYFHIYSAGSKHRAGVIECDGLVGPTYMEYINSKGVLIGSFTFDSRKECLQTRILAEHASAECPLTLFLNTKKMTVERVKYPCDPRK